MAASAKAIQLGHPSYVWRNGQERRLNQIRAHVPLEGRRILDVGCGLGLYVEQLRRFSPHVYGVDVDEEKVGLAGLRLPNIYTAPAEALPFEDESFDVILLNEVIEHVQDDRQSIRECYRCLAPGGHLVIYAPNRLYPFETHGFFFRGRYYGPCNLPLVANWVPDRVRRYFAPHVRIYTARQVRALFDGLQVELVVEDHIFPGLDNFAASGALGRLLRDTVHALERTPLRRFGISHFVVVRKVARVEAPPPAGPRQAAAVAGYSPAATRR